MTQKILDLSEQLLLAIKKQAPTKDLRQQLARMTQGQLLHHLTADSQRLAFWINVYNAYFLYLRRDVGVDKPDIYRQALIPFADFSLSLDDIEHGILRRGRAKWSLGFLPNLFYSQQLQQLMVSKLDYRIHFALNCGAQSCPPIAFYQSDRMDQQLEMATESFLTQETHIDEPKHILYVTRLALWYLGDFGGRSGLRRILQKHLRLPEGRWRIKFQSYNWDENLANFA